MAKRLPKWITMMTQDNLWKYEKSLRIAWKALNYLAVAENKEGPGESQGEIAMSKIEKLGKS